MTVRRVIMCLWVASMIASAAAQQERSPDLAVNGSFEELDEAGAPAGWIIWPDPLPEPNAVSIDETFAHSGKRSLRISHTNPANYSRADQVVNFEPNKTYVITAWIKGDDITPGEGAMGARLYIGLENDNSFQASKRFIGTFEWEQIEIGPFEVKERTWLKFIPYLHQCSGTVWFDDLTFREVTPAEMHRRAQNRARNRALADLDIVEAVAKDSGADAVLPDVEALRARITAAEDLPITLDPRHGPPYFDQHEDVFKLMARANQGFWAALKTVPTVAAHWVEPFDDVQPAQAARPQPEGIPWLAEMLREETEPACIRLANLTEQAQETTLQLTGLTSKSGDELSPAGLTWRALRYVETGDGKLLADALPRIATGAGPVTVSIPPGMTQDIWLMIDSRGVAAGQYEGQVKVSTGTGAEQSLLLSVIVYPVTFPEELEIQTFAYAYTSWPLLTGRTEQSRQDLIAHRINTYVIHGGFTPWPTFDAQGEWQGLDWTRMDAQIALHATAKCLLLWPGLELVDRINSLTPKGGPEYPSEEWKTFAARWAKELGEGMVARGFGYDDWALYPVDEPSGRRAQIVRAAGDAIRVGDPQIRIFENPYGAASEADMELMAPVVDIWCPALNIAKDESLEFCRENADEVWMYQVLGKPSHPLKVFRLAFWEAFQKDLRGYGFWDYADCGESVWDAYDSNRHDYSVVYDGDETELIPSKRWEGYREGAEDHALLTLARERGSDAASDDVLTDLLESPDAAKLSDARRRLIRAIAEGR